MLKTMAEATKAAKLDGIYYATECLQNRLDGDLTDPVEIKAYQKEIARLLKAQIKLGA